MANSGALGLAWNPLDFDPSSTSPAGYPKDWFNGYPAGPASPPPSPLKDYADYQRTQSATDVLDRAAARLMDEYVPDYANRAAGAGAFEALGAGRPGSLAAALGGGITGRLNADISRIDLPIK